MITKRSGGSKRNMLNLKITDNNMLYEHYLPFLKRGGLFIKTTKTYNLGDEIFIFLILPHEEKQTPVTGHVAWINPQGAHGRRPAGIGVHLSDKYQAIRKKIETTLATLPNTDKPTHTM